MVNIRQLESFVEVARLGSISKAAEFLYVSQSALTQQMSGLERHLGFKVFRRTTQGVSLTRQGETFLPYALSIVNTFGKGIEHCRLVSDVCVRVGSDYESTFLFIPEISREMHRRHPGSNIICQESSLRNVLPTLVSGQTDVCLFTRCRLVETMPDATFVPLFESRPHCFVDPRHPLASCTAVTLEDLRHRELVVVPEEYDDCYQSLREHIVRHEKTIVLTERSDNPFLQDATEGDGAVFVGPHWRYGTFVHGRYVRIPLQWPSASVEGLVYRGEPSEGVKQYISCAQWAFSAEGPLCQVNSAVHAR